MDVQSDETNGFHVVVATNLNAADPGWRFTRTAARFAAVARRALGKNRFHSAARSGIIAIQFEVRSCGRDVRMPPATGGAQMPTGNSLRFLVDVCNWSRA